MRRAGPRTFPSHLQTAALLLAAALLTPSLALAEGPDDLRGPSGSWMEGYAAGRDRRPAADQMAAQDNCPDPGSWVAVDRPTPRGGVVSAQGWDPCADLPRTKPRANINIDAVVDPSGMLNGGNGGNSGNDGTQGGNGGTGAGQGGGGWRPGGGGWGGPGRPDWPGPKPPWAGGGPRPPGDWPGHGPDGPRPRPPGTGSAPGGGGSGGTGGTGTGTPSTGGGANGGAAAPGVPGGPRPGGLPAGTGPRWDPKPGGDSWGWSDHGDPGRDWGREGRSGELEQDGATMRRRGRHDWGQGAHGGQAGAWQGSTQRRRGPWLALPSWKRPPPDAWR